MKILYFGVHEINKDWGAEQFINKGFNDLGHETHCIDYRKHRDDLEDKISRVKEPCDILFLQRGDNFPLHSIESFRGPRIFLASELVSRCRDQDRLLAEHKLFNHIFFRTQDCINEAMKNWGVPGEKCSIFLSGFDTETYYKTDDKKEIEILYSGLATQRRVNILNQIHKHFKVTASNAFGEDLGIVMGKSKIILNIHADNFLDTETRVFEVLGSGNFLLTEKLSVENPFKNMVHLVEFESVQELLWRINYYLTNEEERKLIENAGYDEALKNHTYLSRAKYIIEVMEEIVNGKNR